MMKLIDELEAAGWKKDAEDFEDILTSAFANMFPNWTDEDMKDEPRHAMHYCNVVRQRSRLADLPDRVILRALTNLRKRGYSGITLRDRKEKPAKAGRNNGK